MKTKLGLSNELLTAIFYLLLLAAVFTSSSICVYGIIVLGAYVLYKEEDMFLKASVVKGILLVVFVTFINLCLGYVDNLLDFINFFLGIAETAPLEDGFGIVSWIMLIIRVIEKLVLMLLAVFAFKRKTVKLPLIDSIITKHMQ